MNISYDLDLGRGLALVFVFASSLSAWRVHAGPVEEHAKFREQIQIGVTAFEAREFARAQEAFGAAVKLEPQQPRAIYNLAAATAGRGDATKALALLDRYVAMGVKGSQDLDADFPALESLPAFARIKDRLAQNAIPLCPCTTEFDGDAAPFIAEGVALHGNRILVAGIHARRIVVISAGKRSDFVASLPDGLSPFGMATDAARGLLWVAATSLPQSDGATAQQHGHSALLAFDLNTGERRAYHRAPGDAASALGDVTIGSGGVVYVTDSNGALLRLKKDATALEPFGKAGALISPQGIAARSDGRYGIVADYALGLQRIDLGNGQVTPIAVPETVTTLGIDGIALLKDGAFVATQNGLTPARVVRFLLTPDWSRVLDFKIVARASPEISDPTLIAADGDAAVLTGISQWASFDEQSAKPARTPVPWKLVRLDLR